MKTSFKKIAVVILTIILLLSAIPFTASAATSGSCGDNLTWLFNQSTGELTISGIGDMYGYEGDPEFDDRPWKSYVRSIKTVTIGDGVTSIGVNAFSGCSYITDVVISDSVIEIGDWAFYYCLDLDNVEIPDSVTIIGNNAFSWCLGLTSVTIPDSVTTIGAGAFSDCSFITDVVIPDGVTTIGNSAFSSCDKLTSVAIPDSVTKFGESVFYHCDKLTGVTIGNGVTTIGYGTFESCKSLTSVTIPDSVTTIEDSAFTRCTSLTGVAIGNSVTTIGKSAFAICESLTNVTIGDSVTTIGSYAFSGCSSLAGITIPDSVTSIGDSAFYNCDSLTSVTIPGSVTTIGDKVFNGCNSLVNIFVDGNNQYYSNDSYGVLYNKDKTELIRYPIGNEKTEFIIPDSVTTVDYYAFYYCDSLTSITFGNSVTTIGYYAFEGCINLTNITFGDSVTTIGLSAFESCTGLTDVTFGHSVTTIDNYSFFRCTGLKSVTFGKSVTSIRSSAFAESKSLTDVYFNGTEDEWNNISIREGNDSLLNATIHFLGDTHTHIYTSSITTPATCNREGVTTYTCSCGDSYTRPIPTKDHSWGDWTITITPTATESGTKTRLCISCEVTETVTIPAIGFELTDGVTIDFSSNIISGLSAGATSLDGYTTTVNDSYVWAYETADGNLGTGSTVTLKDGEKVIGEYKILIYGDTNGDSWYDGADSIIVSCFANGMLTQNDVNIEVYKAADCNHDGVIDVFDVALLEQAGALLASVDQSKSVDELATDEAYIEYLDLIDQSPEAENSDEEGSADVEPPENNDAEISIIELIINFIKSIFDFFSSFVTKE